MEITREKPADIRVSDQSSPKQARPEPDVVSTLEQGTRFQATVLESKGMFAMIDTGEGQTLRARSSSPLPQGASVQLEVTEPGSPVQVRLVSTISQEQDQQTMQAQALNREMLNMRAKLSALHSVFSKYSMTTHREEGQVDGRTDTSGSKTDDLIGTLLKGIQQGAEADPAKARSMSALLQPSSSSGKSMLEDIVAAFRAINRTSETNPTDSRPVPPNTGLQAGTAQGTGTAQPRLATSQHAPAGAAYRPGAGEQAAGWKPSGKQGMTGSLQPDPPSPSSKNTGFTPLVRMQRPSTEGKSKAAGMATQEAASPQGTVRPQTPGTPEGAGDARYTRPSRASNSVQQPSVTKPAAQETDAGHKFHMQPPAKNTGEPERPGHFEHLVRNNQPSSEHGQAHAATDKGIDSPHQPMPSSKPPGTSHGKAPVTTGGKAGFQLDENLSPKTGAHTLQGDMTTPSPADSTAPQVNPKGVIPSVEPESVQNPMAGTTEHTENSQGKTAQPTETSQRSFASDSSAHRLDSPAPAPQHRDLAWHTHKDSMAAGGSDPAHDDQALQPQNSAQQADRPASHESGILRFFNALASHGQSLHQYQQQVQNFLNSPFFMVPLWFENGQGHGHWSWWREEAEHDTDDRGEVEHLAFDLELTGLGRINMHLLRQDHGLSLHAAASRQALPVLRAGMQELKERMESIGFSFRVADIFPIEETDSTELLSPIPPAVSMSTSSVSIIA